VSEHRQLHTPSDTTEPAGGCGFWFSGLDHQVAAMGPEYISADTSWTHAGGLRIWIDPFGALPVCRSKAATGNIGSSVAPRRADAHALRSSRRVAAEAGPLKPKTVRNVHVTIHKPLSDGVRWRRITRKVADLADLRRSLAASARPGPPINSGRSWYRRRTIGSVRCGASSPRRGCGAVGCSACAGRTSTSRAVA
jgi:hypothetical protein